MKFSTRFAQGIFTLLIIEYFKPMRITSTFIAEKMNGNPVVYRNLLGRLKHAGLVTVTQGNSREGIKLNRPLSAITLLDVLVAVEDVDSLNVFKNHDKFSEVSDDARLISEILFPYFEASLKASCLYYDQVTLGDIMDLFLIKQQEQQDYNPKNSELYKSAAEEYQ